MKKIYLTLLLALLTTLGAQAYDAYIGGIYYNLNGDEATVTYRYEYHDDYWDSVTIPSTVTYNSKTYRVTAIGSRAFNSCSDLTSVTIPNSVTTIGERAFSGCI